MTKNFHIWIKHPNKSITFDQAVRLLQIAIHNLGGMCAGMCLALDLATAEVLEIPVSYGVFKYDSLGFTYSTFHSWLSVNHPEVDEITPEEESVGSMWIPCNLTDIRKEFLSYLLDQLIKNSTL